MALSPWVKPSILNGGLLGRSDKGGWAKPAATDAFDKRYTGEVANSIVSKPSKISDAKTVADMCTNALGTRSPYYVIGEIQSTALGKYASRYMQDTVGNIVRAVTDIYDAVTEQGQAGVIIDGFGDISGKIDVEFSKNPVVFVSNSVSDNRVRTPNTVNMKIYVSNYYNDNGLGAAEDYIASLDKSGIVGEAFQILLHNGNTRAQEALYNLRRIQERGRPFTVYTPHGVYENMLIQSLKPRTTAENVDMLECDIVFQEVIMYEPYYTAPDNQTYPVRTNILTDSQDTTYSNVTDNMYKKISKLFK